MTDPDPDALAEYRDKRHFDRTSEPSGDTAAADNGEPEATGAADGRRRTIPPPGVRGPEARRLPAALRLSIGAGGRSQILGRSQGTLSRPGGQAAGGDGRGSSPGLRHLRGGHPGGRIRGRNGDALGLGMVGARRRLDEGGEGARGPDARGGARQGRAEVRQSTGRSSRGSWALVKTKWQGENNWLLIKHRDDAARPGSNIEREAPDSVATGRSLEQIAAESAASGAAEGRRPAEPATETS